MSAPRPAETPREASANPTAGQPPRAFRPIQLRPSKRLGRCYWTLIVALAVLALLAVAPAVPAQPLWCLPLILFGLLIRLSNRRYRQWRSHHPWQLSADSHSWLLDFPGAKASAPAVLSAEVLVWPGLLILPMRLTDSGATYTVICLADTAARDDLRRLRVQLRTG